MPFEAQEAGLAFPFFDFVAAINYYHRHRAGLHGGEEDPVSANVPDMAGKVMTVRGPMDPDQLGPTLMHEHLFIALYKGVAPDDYTPATDWCLWDQELTIDKLDLARDWKPIRDNWILVDEKTAIDEAMEFRITAAAPLSKSPVSASGGTRWLYRGYPRPLASTW